MSCRLGHYRYKIQGASLSSSQWPVTSGILPRTGRCFVVCTFYTLSYGVIEQPTDPDLRLGSTHESCTNRDLRHFAQQLITGLCATTNARAHPCRAGAGGCG